MPQVIIFIIIAVGLLAFGYIHNLQQDNTVDLPEEEKGNEAATKQNEAKTSPITPSPTTITTQQQPGISVDTEITAGPRNNEILRTATQVTFQFKGIVSPANTQGVMSYETKLVGLDSTWQETFSSERSVNLPTTSKQYTFMVRAKINNHTDPTPAQRNFQIGLSSYSGKVKISSVSQDKVVLTTSLTQGEIIDITGWKIKGNRGEITIPQGTELYLAVGATTKDIFVKTYDTINLHTGQSPFLNIKSFRPNKCFGYLKASLGASFPFSYSKICPKVDCANFSYLSQPCQTALNTLDDGCNPLNYSRYPQAQAEPACVSYAENYAASYLNYNGCVETYTRDKDFYKNEWDIYVGYSIFCRCIDTLYLFDQNGSLVSSYHYEIK